MTVCIILRGLFRNDRPAITIPNAVVSSFLRCAFMGIEASVVHFSMSDRETHFLAVSSADVVTLLCLVFIFLSLFPSLQVQEVGGALGFCSRWFFCPSVSLCSCKHRFSEHECRPFPLSLRCTSHVTPKTVVVTFSFTRFFCRASTSSIVCHALFLSQQKKSRFFLFLVGEKRKIVLPPSRSRLSGSNERGRSD